MLATFVSIVFVISMSVGIQCFPGVEQMLVFAKDHFELLFILTFFLSLAPWIYMLLLSQGAEVQPITMAALRSNIGDWQMYWYSAGIAGFSVVGMMIGEQLYCDDMCAFSASIVCAGIILDLLRMAYVRLQYRRTPEGLAEWFIHVMKQSVQRRDERWHTICLEIPFSLMAVYMKCGAFGSMRLFCHKIVDISDLWLGSIARLLVFKIPSEYEESLLDRYARAEKITSKRIAWTMQEACDIGSVPGLEEITHLAGRLFITFHSHHESLGSILLLTLLQASQRATGKLGPKEVDMEVVSSFCETIALLIERSIERNTSEATSILKVLLCLDTKMKEVLHREKAINPALVIQPLVGVHRMLGHHRYLSFLGREEVLAEIQRMLTHYVPMEGVFPHFGFGEDREDTASSFHEGLPGHFHRSDENPV